MTFLPSLMLTSKAGAYLTPSRVGACLPRKHSTRL